MKKIFLTIMIMGLFLLTGCSSKEVTVKVEIDCTEILENINDLSPGLQKHIPKDGKILELTEITVKEGDDAVTVLKKTADKKGFVVDDGGGYVKGINYIYEKSCGNNSGWVYEVNDEMIMTEYTVKDGDVITWKYICDFSSYGK